MKTVSPGSLTYAVFVLFACGSPPPKNVPPFPEQFLAKDAMARIHGRWIDSQGQPLAGERFVVVQEEEVTLLEGVTNSKGEYSFQIQGSQAAVLEESTSPYWSQVYLQVLLGTGSTQTEVIFRLFRDDVDFEIPDVIRWPVDVAQSELADGTLQVHPFVDVPDLDGLDASEWVDTLYLPKPSHFVPEQKLLSLSPWQREDFELFIRPEVSWGKPLGFLSIRQKPRHAIALPRGSKIPASRGAYCSTDKWTLKTCPYTDGKLTSYGKSTPTVLTLSFREPTVLGRLIVSGLYISRPEEGTSSELIIETSTDGQSWKAIYTTEITHRRGGDRLSFSDEALTGDGLVLTGVNRVSLLQLRIVSTGASSSHFESLEEVSAFRPE